LALPDAAAVLRRFAPVQLSLSGAIERASH
jgi:hypothetical protein